MGCGSCTSRKTVHQVRFADGTVRNYPTEGEAKVVAAKSEGAEYQKVQR